MTRGTQKIAPTVKSKTAYPELSHPEAPVLEVRQACCGYAPGQPVVKEISFTVEPGEIVCVLGANGIGKTTLFKSILGHLPLLGGAVRIQGKDIGKISRPEMARVIGYVPQAHVPPFPFTVGDVVTMGRTAHLSLFSAPSRNDELIALGALEKLGIAGLFERPYTEISGGERQLVLIARALAQETTMLLMDEPIANLDFGNQVRILEQIRDLAASGLAIFMTTHFPDHALQSSTKCIIIESADTFTIGQAEVVITQDLLKRIYNIDAEVITVETAAGPTRVCLPLMRKGRAL